MILTSNAHTKICGNCGEEKPLGEFRRRRRDSDSREGQCRPCYNAYRRRWRARRRGKRLDRFAGELARQKNLSQAAALCTSMMSRFGGIQGFAKTWADQLQAAAAERPGSPTVLRGLGGIIKLIELSDAHSPKQDLSQVSDKALETEMRSLITSLLSDTQPCPV